MSAFILWLEAHEKLAGWAQFFGTLFAVILTYFTAFLPIWNHKRQLRRSAQRLLSNGYEVIESYHRTSANYLPSPVSIRMAALSMVGVAEEIDRFPIFELNNQGPRSDARHLITTALTLKALRLFLEPIAVDLEDREGNAQDQEAIRFFVGERLNAVRAMLVGAELKRPGWPVTD